MVLKWPFVDDIEKETRHNHCLGLLGDRALNPYDSFSGMMVLEKPFVSDTGEDSSLQSLIRSQGGRALSHSPRRQSFKLN